MFATTDLRLNFALQAIYRFELLLLPKSYLVLNRLYALIENFERSFNLRLPRLQSRVHQVAKVAFHEHDAVLELLLLVLLLVKLAVDGVGDADKRLHDALLHRNWLDIGLCLLHERLAEGDDWLEDEVHQAQRAGQPVPLELFLGQIRLGQLLGRGAPLTDLIHHLLEVGTVLLSADSCCFCPDKDRLRIE